MADVVVPPIVPYSPCAFCAGKVQRNPRGTYYHLDPYEVFIPCSTPTPAA